MGKIGKIIKKGPVEGQTAEVYPVTSTKAVYDENNKRLDNIITGLQESIYSKGNGTITEVRMNGASKGTSGVVDLGTVITSHQDISGKADKSAAIGSLSLSLDSTNYKITLSGTKVDGTTFTVSDVIDLPLESVVVNGSYNNTTKKVVLTLQSGSTVEFSVADLVSGLQSEITSTNKLSADLIADGTTNKVVTASEKTTWNGKQDALTNADVLTGITSTKVSNWDNAATNSHTHSNKSVLDGISSTDITNWNSKTDNVGTVTGVKMNGTTNNPTNGVVDLGTVLTEHQDISEKQDKTDNTLATTDKTVIGAINEINTKVGNLTGALTWKGKLDTLPAVTDYEAGNVISVGNKEYVLTVTGSTKAWEELGDEGSYLLKSAAEETYAKKTDIPTIPAIPTVNNPKVSIKMNGTEKGSFTLNQASAGEVDLGTVITAHQDISGKQDKLISGTNIKTINGKSILGSGDITISSGASSSAYPEVNHGTGDTTFTLTPNTFHVWDEVTSLTLNFGSGISGVANEYLFQFTSGPTATSLTLPDDIKWANDNAPTIEANMIYQVSVLRGLASVLEFNNAKVFPIIGPNDGSANEEYAKVYEYFVNTYNLTSSSSDPSNGVIITETLICNDINYGGPVLKVSLDGTMLLLWTQKAINSITVPTINNLGNYYNYTWD